jgi:1-aminocyclopropane-1-carboxylate deaminase
MALQDASVTATISRFTSKTNWELVHDYTFGGYAKISPPFIAFLNRFYQQYGIPLDPIYTGKMVFGIFDLIQKQKWKWGQKILIIHSGGLQGIAGINAKLQKKGEPLLNYSSHY